MAVSSFATPIGALLAGWAGSMLPLTLIYGSAGALVVLMALPFLSMPHEFAAIGRQGP